jgi:pyruvate/oxaloacetate carboxyltransferase/biotin carboxyl carrier protein
VQRACDNGIDIFRVFDALNDFRNFLTVVKVIQNNRRHFQGTICYSLTEPRMGGEVYNLEYYVAKARLLAEMGADSICVKDMAGMLAPYDAYDLVVALKEAVRQPIHLHTHFTSGMGDLALLKAVEAGVDLIDTCLAPYAYRSSHPAIEPLVVSLLGTDRDTGMDIAYLVKIDEELEKRIPKYQHLATQTRFSIIDPEVMLHQTPGGMLSNLVNQLKEMGALDRLEEVFQALPGVRRDLGQVPLVTPTSQIIGIQTVNNVLFDEGGQSYTRITEQVRDLCYGLYGETPRPIDAEVRRKALSGYSRGGEPIRLRPGEILEPELETARRHAGDLAKDLDDLLIFALFPVTGRRFLMWKYGLERPPDEVRARTLEDVHRERELVRKALSGELVEKGALPEMRPAEGGEALRSFDVYVNGEHFRVQVAASGASGGSPVAVQSTLAQSALPEPAPRPAPLPTPEPAAEAASPPPAATSAGPAGVAVPAPMPGMILACKKRLGEQVKAGETVVVVEAMKMHNNIVAPCDGLLAELPFQEGESVAKGAVLFRLAPP